MAIRPNLTIQIPPKKQRTRSLTGTPLSDPELAPVVSPFDQLKSTWSNAILQETIDGLTLYVDQLSIPKIVRSFESKSRIVKHNGVYTVYIRIGYTGRFRVILRTNDTVIYETMVADDDLFNEGTRLFAPSSVVPGRSSNRLFI